MSLAASDILVPLQKGTWASQLDEGEMGVCVCVRLSSSLPLAAEEFGKGVNCLGATSLSCVYLHFSEHPSLCHLPDHFVGSLLYGEWQAFLVTSSNSFLLPITAALDLSGPSCSRLELIQVPISVEQEDSNDAAVSQLGF